MARYTADSVERVKDAIDEPDDAPLERARQRRAPRVARDPVADVIAEV